MQASVAERPRALPPSAGEPLMSQHYRLLRVSKVDLPRIEAMRDGNALGRGVLIDAAPFSLLDSIIACPADGNAAEIIEQEVQSEAITVEELRQMHRL